MLDVIGVFVVDLVIMSIAYAGSAVLLLLPTLFVNILKQDKNYIKYVNVVAAALFTMLLSITLTYHEVAEVIKQSSDEVAESMKQINDNTQENCIAVEQVTASSQENTAGTESLTEIVEQIKVLSERLKVEVKG